jgi:transketolase
MTTKISPAVEEKLTEMARKMRRKILDVSKSCNTSAHIGGGLSMVEITATLYGEVMRYDPKNPEWEKRDRFILSKGHGVLGYFTALNVAGVFDDSVMNTFQQNESDLIAHPIMNLPLGIESSNGSLGHGLSMGVGLALAAKKLGKDHKVYVYLGDGECNEGSVWESVMSGATFKLDNLIAIVDVNRLQNDGPNPAMTGGNMAKQWASFGWNVCEVDGHDIPALYSAFTGSHVADKPKAVVAHTVKGKGVSFMENNNEWHHNRVTQTIYDRAIAELDGVSKAGAAT